MQHWRYSHQQHRLGQVLDQGWIASAHTHSLPTVLSKYASLPTALCHPARSKEPSGELIAICSRHCPPEEKELFGTADIFFENQRSL